MEITTYRRHSADCKHKDDRYHPRCGCPLWFQFNWSQPETTLDGNERGLFCRQQDTQARSESLCVVRCNSAPGRTETDTKSRSLKSDGRGLSRYAAWAKPHSFSVISGVSGERRKKFGSTPNRSSTPLDKSDSETVSGSTFREVMKRRITGDCSCDTARIRYRVHCMC